MDATSSPNYPINLVLDGRRCVVVGGGNVAIRKVEGLLASGAHVTVIAPEIRTDLAALPGVTIVPRRYQHGDLAGTFLAITCTDNPAVNAQVYADGDADGIWVNSADDPVNCAFTLPSVARQGDLTVSVSTAGRSPAMAMWLRQRFEAEFDERYARLLDILAEVRAEVRARFGTSEVAGWLDALDDGVFDLVSAGDDAGARDRLRRHLGLDTPRRSPERQLMTAARS